MSHPLVILTRKTSMNLPRVYRVHQDPLVNGLTHAIARCLPRWLGASLLLLTACGSPTVSLPPLAETGRLVEVVPTPSPPAEPLAFSASTTGLTEDLAYAQATRQLLVALLKDESLLAPDTLSDRLADAVHERASQFFRTAKTSRGVEVEVGLRSGSLPSVFARLDAALLNVPVPETSNELVPAVHAARLVHLRRALCVRQKELVAGVTCEAVDTSVVDRQLAEVVAGVTLRSAYPDGIPSRDHSWLRPIVVEAVIERGGAKRPMSNLPVRIQSNEHFDAIAAETGANGVVSQPIPKTAPVSATWTVSLDADRVLGSLAKLVPPVAMTLQARATRFARSALVFARGKPPIPETAQTLLQSLSGRITQPVELVAPDARLLAEASEDRMAGVAPTLADRLRGALDTILVLDAESEFASRMGTQRVWYEARGTLRAYDAWTGVLLTFVTATVTESGLGEPRAESAAREALGRELARRLEQRLLASAPTP